MTNSERCSCGVREKNKCSKESEHGSGKMCVKGGMEDIGIPKYDLFGQLFKLGVTQVTERWHDLLIVELILQGDFKDEDIAKCLYQKSPMMYRHVGDITQTVEGVDGMLFKYGFTRG